MHKIHNSPVNILGVISLCDIFCDIFCPKDNSCSTDTIEMKFHIYIERDEKKWYA